MATSNTTFKTDRLTLTGVRWTRLLSRKPALAAALAQASLDAANLESQFPQTHYALCCARLRASVPHCELIAEGAELRTTVPDEQFFATHPFRATRFHLTVPECRVSGVAYEDLLQGKLYRAESISFSHPSFDALVNRDKPVEPLAKRPLMVNEALAAIPKPLLVGLLSLTNGHLTYAERVVAGASPGVLTFAAVTISVAGIANHSEPLATVFLRAQGELMEAGILKVLMSIPITPTNFALRYSGSLGPMDLTRLNAFLEIAERTRIKSGSAQAAAFEVDVTDGHAHGRVLGTYRNLEIAILDQKTDTEKGLVNRMESFLANALRIRRSNSPDTLGSVKRGT